MGFEHELRAGAGLVPCTGQRGSGAGITPLGTLRILLVTAVVIAHTGPIAGLTLTGAVVAVHTFFIVSGFYMALVLTEKYAGPHAYRLFIGNRILKLFPPYWAVLALTLLVSIVSIAAQSDGMFLRAYVDNAGVLGLGTVVVLAASNLVILGQDAVMFLRPSADRALAFTSDFAATEPPLYTFLLVPQAWSLAVEFWFYLSAPFLVARRTWTLVALACVSLAWRAVNYRVFGWNHDPWTYRFFPTELIFFLAGIMSYRLYRQIRVWGWPHWTVQGLSLALPGLMLLYQFVPNHYPKSAFLYCTVVLLMPFGFLATRESRWDRALGDLAYPMFVGHLVVLNVIVALAPQLAYATLLPPLTLLATAGLSYVLLRLVSDPIDTVRQARVTADRRGASKVNG